MRVGEALDAYIVNVARSGLGRTAAISNLCDVDPRINYSCIRADKRILSANSTDWEPCKTTAMRRGAKKMK